VAYPGQHDAIIERELFDAVQAKLSANSVEHREKRTALRRGLLSGLLFDNRGNAMNPSLSRKPGGGSYLYYISQARIQRREIDAMRPIPAEAIETIVCERVAGLVTPACSSNDIREHVRDLITRVEVGSEQIAITFNRSNLSRHVRSKDDQIATTLRERLQADDTLDEPDGKPVLTTPARIPRRGGVRRVEVWEKSDWTTATVRHDASLIKALTEVHEWRELIERGEILTMEDLSASTGHDRKYVRRTLKLALLAPDIQRAILEGRQPRSLTVPALAEIDLPMLWLDQRALLSFAAA
jgi:site-specific DNA recombinase